MTQTQLQSVTRRTQAERRDQSGRSLLEAARYNEAIAEFRETLHLRPEYLKA